MGLKHSINIALFVLLSVLSIGPLSAQTPDGVEDAVFAEGYWAASYYQGRDGTPGSSSWGSSANGTGGAGTKTYHGEAFWGIGQNDVLIASNGSASFNRWSNTETPTSPNLHHPSYVGTVWTNSNPHYQIDFRRKMMASGNLTFGYGANEIVDDVIDVYVNGIRRYAYFPTGGAPNPRPGQGVGASISVNAGDTVLVRFINLGFIGGFTFNFSSPPDPVSLAVEKSSRPFSSGTFSIPGNDMLYSVVIENNGPGTISSNSLFVVDSLPDQLTFFNGDFNGSDPGDAPVDYTDTGTGLPFNPSTDIAYSNSPTPPASFASCSYTPTSGYDPNIRHLCINPKGSMYYNAGNSTFSIYFRTRIN